MITIPVLAAGKPKDWFQPSVHDLLAKICVPFSKAVPGDILAVVQDIEVSGPDHYASAKPIIEVLVRTEEGAAVCLALELGFKRSREVALFGMLYASDRIMDIGNHKRASEIGRTLQVNEPITCITFLTPDAAFMVAQDYDEYLSSTALSANAAMAQISSYLCNHFESQHQRLDIAQALDDLSKSVNAAVTVLDDDLRTVLPLVPGVF